MITFWHTCACACCLRANSQEVQQREEIVARKEAVLAEKRELEMKKLRSSQVLNKVWHGSDCMIIAVTIVENV